MIFVIEKDIPVPEITRGRRPRSYPFDKMSVGDSFEVPAKKNNSVRVCAAQYGKQNGLKFSVRKTENGTRVWRVK